MTTPRPLGVRRADVNEERFVLHLTSTVHARRLYPRAPRGSLRSHSLTPLNQICARLCARKPRKPATVRRKIFLGNY
jgi:hypothetical protein